MKLENKVKKAVIILSVLVFAVLLTVLNNQEEHYDLRDISIEYAELDNSVVAAVNGNEITDRDLCIIKYLYGEKDCLDTAVKQKSVSILAEQKGFYLTSQQEYKETEYAVNLYEKLNLDESEVNTDFKNDLIENQIDLSVLYAYRLSVKKEINNSEFSCDIKTVNFKYNLFKTVNEKEINIPFEIKWAIIDDIASDYINHEISNFEVTYEK